MPSTKRYHSTVKSAHVAKSTWRFTEKAATGLARWATTDHTGTTKLLATMPPLGFVDTVCMLLIQLVFGILGAIGSAFMTFMLFSYGILQSNCSVHPTADSSLKCNRLSSCNSIPSTLHFSGWPT